MRATAIPPTNTSRSLWLLFLGLGNGVARPPTTTDMIPSPVDPGPTLDLTTPASTYHKAGFRHVPGACRPAGSRPPPPRDFSSAIARLHIS
ncbi:hypothetical protein P170DRAFT_203114 [Aspergillus steynii IBT 23096]|uniref:Secreted protein n=1 Tax=Aspergillus steynii IBT 23096 TaxID=1392250 RepID=A0A2I2G568_9EURO|nr:uncharacterized protein P170DRAFT_203114 [Aspergillus steynii IBT 23096]PLB48021.1 hypothetical protein P170DRAFT_203114 [Aspergillus steynii IBT 23096]